MSLRRRLAWPQYRGEHVFSYIVRRQYQTTAAFVRLKSTGAFKRTRDNACAFEDRYHRGTTSSWTAAAVEQFDHRRRHLGDNYVYRCERAGHGYRPSPLSPMSKPDALRGFRLRSGVWVIVATAVAVFVGSYSPDVGRRSSVGCTACLPGPS